MPTATLADAVAAPATDPLDEGLVTVKEAAGITRLSRSKLYLDMDAGRLGYHRFGKSRRLSRAELRRYIDAARVGGDQ